MEAIKWRISFKKLELMANDNQTEFSVKELTFKVIIVGNPGVGKTSIINRGVDQNYQFQDIRVPTTRVSESRFLTQIQGYDITLDIWDAPGGHQITDYRPDYFRQVDGVIMVYDLTNQDSFTFIKNMMAQLSRRCNKPLREMALFIAGNKSDLPIQQLEVYNFLAEDLARQHGATFYETSVKSNSNIDVLFQTLAQQAYNYFNSLNNRNESCLLL